MVELDHCLVGIPVLMHGELQMIDTDSRVISSHLEVQPCESGFPLLIQTAGDNPIWVQISRDIIQVKDPKPLIERINFQDNERMTTLYTREELQNWEQFSSFPAVQRTRTQKILNSLCSEGKCSSAGGSKTYESSDISELTSHAEKVGKEILAKMNPLGFINTYWQGFKDSIVHLLMLEYSAIIILEDDQIRSRANYSRPHKSIDNRLGAAQGQARAYPGSADAEIVECRGKYLRR